MSRKVIIFDFDGTLADTLDALLVVTNRLALEFGYPLTTPDQLSQLRHLSSKEIILQSGVPLFKIPFFLKKVREYLQAHILNLNTIPGIQEALIQLRNDGNCLGILTSNSEENVTLFLQKHGIQDLFSFIYSEPSLFGKDKSLRKVMKKHHLFAEEVIYVGDETRDIEASKKIHIKVIAVSWGFNSGEVLVKYNPDFLIHQPGELIEVLGSLEQIVS